MVDLLHIGAAAPELIDYCHMAIRCRPVQRSPPSYVYAIDLALWVTGQYSNYLHPSFPGCSLQGCGALHCSSYP